MAILRGAIMSLWEIIDRLYRWITRPKFSSRTSTLLVKSLKELIVYAEAKPRELDYAYTIFGIPLHIGSELFKSMASVNIVSISYNGTLQIINASQNSKIQLIVSLVAATVPRVKFGRLRVLAITSTQLSALLPDLPTSAASGLPG